MENKCPKCNGTGKVKKIAFHWFRKIEFEVPCKCTKGEKK